MAEAVLLQEVEALEDLAEEVQVTKMDLWLLEQEILPQLVQHKALTEVLAQALADLIILAEAAEELS